MKALILAALAVSLISAPLAAAAVNPPITDQELQGRAKICIGLATGEITDQQVITGLKLNTSQKIRDMALQCEMFMLGEAVGEKIALQPKSHT